MSNISSSLVSMLYNFQLMRLAGEDGVSAYGVLMYVQFIFISLFVGYSIGCFLPLPRRRAARPSWAITTARRTTGS